MDPQGAVAIITGASSGIGAATAQAFAAAGADVVLAARSTERLEQLAATLPGRPLVVPTDVSDAQSATALVERTVAERGRVDILINNAGIGVIGPVESVSPDDMLQVYRINVLGSLHTIQAVVPHMRQRKRGHIINVSSVVGKSALPFAGGYCASKGAIDRLTEALRMELGGSGIRVTLVRPGTTRTEFGGHRLGHGREVRRLTPRGVPPERVAQTLVRAAHREPRVAYVTLGDRVQLLVAALLPGLVERVVPWFFNWSSEEENERKPR